MDKLIEAVQKRDEAYDLWIMTFDILKLQAKSLGERTIATSPGDLIAGICTRVVLRSFYPGLLKNLDNMGIGPGRFQEKGPRHKEEC